MSENRKNAQIHAGAGGSQIPAASGGDGTGSGGTGGKNVFRRLTERIRGGTLLSSLVCIACGILLGFAVLLLLAIFTPSIPVGEAFRGLGIILGGPFASGRGGDIAFTLGEMLFEATPLMMTGLAVAVAFKNGLFNIGAPGQYLMGIMGSVMVALSFPTDGSNAFLGWILALLTGTLLGVLWGMIPGFFKAFLGVNEVIVCIMTNWIAANVVSWAFKDSVFLNVGGGKTAYTLKTAENGIATPKLGLDRLFPGSNIDMGILIAVAAAVVLYIVINKTTFGYELKACGANREAARYAGMSVRRNIMLSMMISGGLAAMGACLYILNGNIEFAWETYARLPDTGFNGIPVALLATSDPIGVIFSSLFLRYIGKGGYNLAGYTMFNEYVSDLIVALIIYFAGFASFIRMFMPQVAGFFAGLAGRRKKAAGGAVQAGGGTVPDGGPSDPPGGQKAGQAGEADGGPSADGEGGSAK
jgi:simple sugar transport system permease protein